MQAHYVTAIFTISSPTTKLRMRFVTYLMMRDGVLVQNFPTTSTIPKIPITTDTQLELNDGENSLPEL